MFPRGTITISKEMFYSSRPIIQFASIFALFPFSVEKRDEKYKLLSSKLKMMYSYLVGILLIVLTFTGVFGDILAERDKSIRIRNTSDIYITFIDVFMVLLSVICGIFITPSKYATFDKFVKRLNEIDKVLPPKELKKAKFSSFAIMVIVEGSCFVILLVELFIYFAIDGERCGKGFIFQSYAPHYVNYHVLLMNQCVFWHLTYGIFRRIRSLNRKLIKIREKSTSKKRFLLLESDLHFKNEDVSDKKPKDDYISITELVSVYGKLCDSVSLLNQLYGTSNTIYLLGMFAHLIIGPYLFVREVKGRFNIIYTSWMVILCILQLGRLFFLVQPCHKCILEVNNTNTLVSYLLSSKAVEESIKEELRIFSMELIQRNFKFSANGLTNIDMPLITTMIGSITTYLVVLIQMSL